MGFFNLYLYLLLINTIILYLVLFAKSETSATLDSNNQIAVNVGLIFDFDSSTGNMANSCISLALSDFYSKNQHYATRLALYSKNSSDALTATLAALELVNQDQVVAIIGPQYANEARFVAEIGERSQVPIFSLSVKSSSYSPSKTPYFIQTALPDSIQLDGITFLVQQLGWDEIIAIYEDDTKESGNCFIPALIDTFQKASIQLSYAIAISVTSSVSDHIKKELSNLRSIQTRVFLVHVTTPGLASQLFSLANEVGMMTTGTAWIITDALCNSLSSLDATTIESMEGVLGVRPYVPRSKNLQDFEIRWNDEFLPRQKQLKYTERPGNDFNLFCLRAYEAVWSIATSVENIQLPGVNRSHEKLNASSTAITNLRISEAGPRLVKEILETRFQGLSGEFKVEDEQVETPVLEIINIVGNGGNGDRTVGYWTPGRGFSRKIASTAEENHGIVYSKRPNGVLKPIIWPGDSTNKPKGWHVPGMGLKLRVGVPQIKAFREFVNVQEIGNTTIVTGFSIDVFKAALDTLPYRLEPEFIPFSILNDSGGPNRTYDDLVNKLRGTKNLDFEAVVGDVTIRANREREVDFSLPYTDSGVVMVVKAKSSDRLKNIWMFIAPLSWDLWLTIFLATIFIGLVLRMLERRVNPQRQLGMLFLFPLAALAFPERNMVGNNWARFVLVVWLFMAYVLMQGYTANLSSILTVGQLKPSADIPSCAGYQQGSFVKDFLTNWLNMDITKCHSYLNMEAYDEALSLGCKNGGVDAIYDEIPYIKLFLHKYGSKYKMVGTTYYNSGGFGFAFPIGSPLSKAISKAILDLRELGTMRKIEERYFDAGNTSYYDAEDISQEPSFTSNSFAGLFIITAFFTLLALVCSECSFALSKYRVHSIQMAHDVSPQNDLQLQDHHKEEDGISAQEERKEQDLLQEITDINIDHERMTMDIDQVNKNRTS